VVRDQPFLRCRRCATLFLPVPPVRDAAGRPGYNDCRAGRQSIEETCSGVLDRLEREVGIGRLLDVGTDSGFLLGAARARGWECVRVDPSDCAVPLVRGELGHVTRLAPLEELQFEAESFDAITLMDVVERVPAGGALLGIVSSLLRPNGVVAMQALDAGSFLSRVLGSRWPGVQDVLEPVVFYSASGLERLLRREGLEVVEREWTGASSTISRRRSSLSPRTKVCVYAVKAGARQAFESDDTRRMEHDAEETVLESLWGLAAAQRLCGWMFDQFETPVGGRVAEIGAGIGTFSERLLAHGAAELLLIEPEQASAAELDRRYADDPRVTIARERLPESSALAAKAGTIDLILCQNVLEHIGQDSAAVEAMAAGLRPGGVLSLLVPAHPQLYGRLDAEYGHFRRYTRARLRSLMTDAGLEVRSLYSFNLLGVAGWWLAGRQSSGHVAGARLALYDLAVPLWRRAEETLKPRVGLSLVVHARKPT
jgi:2-polyprenyl-3-methyl-5-hydroxy-6-metoxy-1,4-benzoquinol methylase